MNLKTIFLMLTLSTVFLSACKKESGIKIEETFELTFGSTMEVSNKSLSILFEDIEETVLQCCCYPCPLFARPILEITTADGTVHKIEFVTENFVILHGWRIELLNLEPSLIRENFPPKQDYVLELKVTEL